MKLIFTLCLAAVLMTAGCSDSDKDNAPKTGGTISINGATKTVGSAFYTRNSAKEYEEGGWTLALTQQHYTTPPTTVPEFFITIEVSDSYLGKTIDLTKPVERIDDGKGVVVKIGTPKRMMYTDSDHVDVYEDDKPTDLSVQTGTLTLTRDGNRFSVNLSMKYSDGFPVAASWHGQATQLQE